MSSAVSDLRVCLVTQQPRMRAISTYAHQDSLDLVRKVIWEAEGVWSRQWHHCIACIDHLAKILTTFDSKSLVFTTLRGSITRFLLLTSSRCLKGYSPSMLAVHWSIMPITVLADG